MTSFDRLMQAYELAWCAFGVACANEEDESEAREQLIAAADALATYPRAAPEQRDYFRDFAQHNRELLALDEEDDQ